MMKVCNTVKFDTTWKDNIFGLKCINANKYGCMKKFPSGTANSIEQDVKTY